jgi:hypothetical protein
MERLHSKNIKVGAGYIPLLGLNCFKREKDSNPFDFVTEMFRSISEWLFKLPLIERGMDKPSLVRFSVPLIEQTGLNKYLLTRGWLILGDELLSEGAEFWVTTVDYKVVLRVEQAEKVTLVEADMDILMFDDYTNHSFEELGKDAEEALGLDVKRLKQGEDVGLVKYIGIYAPDVRKSLKGKIVAYNPKLTSTPTSDRYWHDRSLEYDRVAVEFVSTDSPFAYVALEHAYHGGEYEYVDHYKQIWDATNTYVPLDDREVLMYLERYLDYSYLSNETFWEGMR